MDRTRIAEPDAAVIEPVIAPWRAQIEEATSERELLAIANRYLALWTPHFSRLPEDCRPGPISNSEELSHWAFHLARRQGSATRTAQSHLLLTHTALFFYLAYTRLSELALGLLDASRTIH